MTDLPMLPVAPSEPPQSGVVVLGRFQPFHMGHAAMVDAAAAIRDEHRPDATLIIGIGSSNRPQNLANPWSSEEREAMIGTWLEAAGIENTHICAIPDIEDPPNWVSHAEAYHGASGTLVTTDLGTSELYAAAGWEVVLIPLIERERFEGWRIRETARMLSTITDEAALREVLGSLVPSAVLDNLIETNGLHRLAFMGEGGEPVG